LEGTVFTAAVPAHWVQGARGVSVKIELTDGAGNSVIHIFKPGFTVDGWGDTPLPNEPGEPVKPPVAALLEHFPNPFNPLATLRVVAPASGFAEVEVFDVSGRRIAMLHRGQLSSGEHRFVWNAGGLPSGIYLIRFTRANAVLTRKATLLK
jgi:hypothetical protein